MAGYDQGAYPLHQSIPALVVYPTTRFLGELSSRRWDLNVHRHTHSTISHYLLFARWFHRSLLKQPIQECIIAYPNDARQGVSRPQIKK